MVSLNNMWVIKNKKIFIAISSLFVLGSLFLIFVQGLTFGIEFKGGSLAEVEYINERPEISEIIDNVEALGFGEVVVQPTQTNGVFIKTRDLSEEERVLLMNTISQNGQVEVNEKSFTSIGASVGEELRKKSTIALILVVLGIILFIAFSFRGISKPVSSWKYGIIAIITLIHDVIIATGAFAIMGKIAGAEVDTLFVVAVLTILGLSVNDTIVVFDRVRENIKNKISPDFSVTVGKSLDQTYVRSVNTSFSVIIVLLALFFFGPESTKIFAMTLVVGMFFGTYSSVFIASPLLVIFESLQKKKDQTI
ncbi:MAG: Protein-export rane protein SecF [Patescibacteria group bacterium]|nr:Protein-export rane protein SecF [Patescibacteria group bacterium]